MKQSASADIVIFGGGVAGLWLLNRIRQTGLSVILFETNALGGGQTNKSQGIIHGGMKYALQGTLTKDAYAMADMPAVWQACLQGKGDIDLTKVPVLSTQHYLWAPGRFASKLGGFFAGATLTTKVSSLKKNAYPAVFQDAAFKGDVFSMDELVLDVPVLVRELVKTNHDVIFKINDLCESDIQLGQDGEIKSVQVKMADKTVKVSAQHFVFTAGAGNELVCQKLKSPVMAMQRRPLHMVLVKLPFNADLYAHCIGMGSRPRVTITTHRTQQGETIWYLGGLIAEEGVQRDAAAQIKAARNELDALFPWLDFSKAEFASFMIDRAEPKQQTGLKPESTFNKTQSNVTVAWPTKLALAPKLAEDVLMHLQKIKLEAKWLDIHALFDWPMPPLAIPAWEEMFCKVDA